MRADKKKFSTRLMAALMAGTLAAGMMGMNVSAASVHSGNPITTIPVTKNVLTDGNTMAPILHLSLRLLLLMQEHLMMGIKIR